MAVHAWLKQPITNLNMTEKRLALFPNECEIRADKCYE